MISLKNRIHKNRVVITGIGSITPLGAGFSSSWKALLKGQSGIKPITRISTEGLRWKMGGEIRDDYSLSMLTTRERNRYDLFVHYALIASNEAIEDAGLEMPEDTALFIGSSRGGIYAVERSLEGLYNGKKRISAYLMPSTTTNMAVSALSQRYNLKGYGTAISTACASGSMAIAEAYRYIRDGYGQIAIAGGTEAPITRLCLEGYGRMGVLSSKDAPYLNPFCKGRDGFVLSEGATVIVLEELEGALKRGAKIYAEIISTYSITDGSSQTGSTEKAEAETMRGAITSAGLTIEDIDLITCHATATVAGDRIEYNAMKEVFGKRLEKLPLLPLKTLTGHMLAGSGAFEIATAARMIYEKIVPPTRASGKLEFDLFIPDRAVKREINTTLSNSFGFGGINVSVVLKAFQG